MLLTWQGITDDPSLLSKVCLVVTGVCLFVCAHVVVCEWVGAINTKKT